ncbi:acetylajmalan esterase-like [Chenopodium quinoa]|uniref:acetylajmalan esterase-like n=1 Tax=Chenopodium quinoa TaxID=63459 RepID=UPI000B77E42C|nr:acetylajmalan esterase-like [Chenopodium quinoa]
MANNAKTFVNIAFLLAIALSLHAIQGQVQPPIDTIYQFGDSISDTGNFIRDNFIGRHSNFANLPYGQDFFHKATGRCSNGRLMIDFFAEYFKLPYLDAYLNQGGNFSHGVNFAVVGSTALTSATLALKGILSPLTCSSLSVQLNWFQSHLTSICPDLSDCKSKLANALFIIESGGNDINYALIERKRMQDIYGMVPEVVGAVKAAVEEVISIGATRVVVPGNFVIGCLPIYLYMFPSNSATMYDELHCLEELNELSTFQNNFVQKIVRELQAEHPSVTIVYADYFNAMKGLLQNATALGFDETLRTCCGKGVPVCPNPDKSVNWDGIHMTEHAYKIMADWLLQHNVLPAISKAS